MSQCEQCRYYHDGFCYREPPVWKPEARPDSTHVPVSPDEEACGEFKPQE